MTRARRQVISLDDTPYYHCTARCVRQAYLCGKNSSTGQNFNHRRQWLVDHFKFLSSVFCIDICAYAVMNNHYHLVLFVDSDRANQLSEKQIAQRWTKLFKAPLLVDSFLADKEMTYAEKVTVKNIITLWRKRLMDISWFMRCLNEHIARKANEEDDCKGRFWEGRFKSQALLDNQALLSCMMYVDLNPVRAGIASDLESSDFTSIQERIRSITTHKQPELLSPFIENKKKTLLKPGILFDLHDYIELTDWTGRCINAHKKGFIPPHAPPILEKLGLTEYSWIQLTYDLQRTHPVAVGLGDSMNNYNEHHNKHWTVHCHQGAG